MKLPVTRLFFVWIAALAAGFLTTVSAKASFATIYNSGVRTNIRFYGYSPQKPNAPADLKLKSLSSESIRVRWRDRSNNETGFVIEWAATRNGPWRRFAKVGAGVTSHDGKGLKPGTRYFFRVKAVNDTGASAPTAVRYANTLDPQWAPGSIAGSVLTYKYPGGWFKETFRADGTVRNETKDGEVESLTYTYKVTGNNAVIKTVAPTYKETATLKYQSADSGSVSFQLYEKGRLEMDVDGKFKVEGRKITLTFDSIP